MIMVRLLSPEPVGWLQHHQLYSGLGADIVMESISLRTPEPAHYPRPILAGLKKCPLTLSGAGVTNVALRFLAASDTVRPFPRLISLVKGRALRFMKYNGLFLVPKPTESKTTQQAQPEKTTTPYSEAYREGFREGFQIGWRK